MNPFFQKILDNAEAMIKVGKIHISNIIPDNPTVIPYAFTTGLTELENHPEIFVCGLQPQIACQLLLNAHAAIKDGLRFENNDIINGLNKVPVIARDLDVSQLPPADGILRIRYDDNYAAMQLFWPDINGHFPWDPEVLPLARRLQLECLPKRALKPLPPPVMH